MNKKILAQLDFQQIVAQVAHYAQSDLGKQLCLQLEPSVDAAEIATQLDATQDAVDIIRLKGGMPLPRLADITPALQRLRIGAHLNGKELATVSRVLSTTSEVVRFFEQLADTFTCQVLLQDVERLERLPSESQALRAAVADDGGLYDDASETLRRVRQNIKRHELAIREKLEAMTRGAQAKYLSDPIITLRNDRYVIPVKQEHRSRFGGIVHDQSASGQTLFIEPQSVVDLNNRLRSLVSEEQQEILRIYGELSELLMPHTETLAHNHDVLGYLDMVQSRARYANDIRAVRPQVSTTGLVSLWQARHPLVDPKQVVANDIVIGDQYQTIVITGPNTGGKTILLKTLGLLQVMAQSGLHVPCAENSQVAVFDHIFADIGDEQSIAQNLSTFSSHMTNIVQILSQATENSLLLLDEIGSGTDPQEGAALAIALLDYIGQIGATLVATTHYPELKAYGYQRPGVVNASMMFDGDTLAPTYRLLIGVPGRSNAFDISQRLGLPEQVIQQARAQIDRGSQDLNAVIADLEQQRQQFERDEAAVLAQMAEAEQLLQSLQAEKVAFDAQREHLLRLARDEANAIVSSVQEETEAIFSAVRDMQQRQSQSVVKEHEMIAQRTKLAALHQQEQLQKNKVLQRAKKQKALHPGDTVMVTSYGQKGQLLSQQSETEWLVQMGIIKTKVSIDEIRVVQQEEKKPTRRIANVKSASTSHVNSQLDLRGERYEEALHRLERFLDAALLAGYHQVTIIHGKGTGALREGVSKALRQHRLVERFEYAPVQLGGNGATVAYLKG